VHGRVGFETGTSSMNFTNYPTTPSSTTTRLDPLVLKTLFYLQVSGHLVELECPIIHFRAVFASTHPGHEIGSSLRPIPYLKC